jgi:hypothetical protein
MTNTEIFDSLKKSDVKVYYGKTLDDISDCIKDAIPDKYQQQIMDFLNKVEDEKTAKPKVEMFVSDDETDTTKTIELDLDEKESDDSKSIMVFKTDTASIIVPILMSNEVKFKMSLEVVSQETANQEAPLRIESDIDSADGIVPVLSIPHKNEGIDNEASLSKILDFLKLTFPDNIQILDIRKDNDKVNIETKLIMIKN